MPLDKHGAVVRLCLSACQLFVVVCRYTGIPGHLPLGPAVNRCGRELADRCQHLCYLACHLFPRSFLIPFIFSLIAALLSEVRFPFITRSCTPRPPPLCFTKEEWEENGCFTNIRTEKKASAGRAFLPSRPVKPVFFLRFYGVLALRGGDPIRQVNDLYQAIFVAKTMPPAAGMEPPLRGGLFFCFLFAIRHHLLFRNPDLFARWKERRGMSFNSSPFRLWAMVSLRC